MTALLQVSHPECPGRRTFCPLKLIEASLNDRIEFRSVVGQLNCGNSFEGFRLGDKSLVLSFKGTGEYVKFVRLLKRLDQGGGFLFGLLNQWPYLSRRHHGWACVEVNGDSLPG